MAVKNRVFYYDLLRAIAIVGVILCHVDGIYEFTTASLKLAIPSMLNCIGLLGVPIFLMLSGALLLNRDFTLSYFFKRRFTRVIYPFIFWMIITILIGFVFLNWNSDMALKTFFGTPAPSWYIWVLIGIYLFLPVINSYIKEYHFKGMELFLGIWLFTIILSTFNLYPFKRLELSYFAGYIGFVVLGYYLDNKKFSLSDKKMFYLGIATLIIFTFLHMFFRFNHAPIFYDKYLNIILVIQSIGLFLSVKYLDAISSNTKNIYEKIKTGSLGKLVISISVCSYGMYFTHSIILKFIKLIDINSIKLLPLILIFVVFLSWAIIVILSRIPYIKKVCGI